MAVRAGGLSLEANREYAKGRFPEALPLYEEALCMELDSRTRFVVLRKSEPTWAEAKKQLGDPGFLNQLVTYDKDALNDAMLNKVSAPPFTPPSLAISAQPASRRITSTSHAPPSPCPFPPPPLRSA